MRGGERGIFCVCGKERVAYEEGERGFCEEGRVGGCEGERGDFVCEGRGYIVRRGGC